MSGTDPVERISEDEARAWRMMTRESDIEQDRKDAEARTQQICYTCCFWHPADQSVHSRNNTRMCALTRHSAVSVRTGHDYGQRPALAWGIKGEAYWLQTAPTFGCNQWEANEHIYRPKEQAKE